jgi:tungstate transport system ATP-binding protein
MMCPPSSILPLRLVEVSFHAGGRAIIDRVNLELAAGTRTVILGANGAGKSVLMRLMHGLLAPSSGRIEWSESDAKRLRARQAMVFQRPVMLRRSALANVAYGLEIAGVPRPERERRTWECLERVGLAHLAARAARVLSGGEQQRLALARALARHPQVLFLDEPTASLDPAATKSVEDVVQAVVARGIKVVMSTHDLGDARRLAGDIVLMHRGRVIENTPTADFFSNPKTEEARRFVAGELLI